MNYLDVAYTEKVLETKTSIFTMQRRMMEQIRQQDMRLHRGKIQWLRMLMDLLVLVCLLNRTETSIMKVSG